MSTNILIQTCPGCGSHLGDTWDRDALECSNCGFAYVSPFTTSRDAESASGHDPFRPVKSITAGLLAVQVAFMTGGVIDPSNLVSMDQSGSGVLIDVYASGGWLVVFGGLGVALLLVFYATGGEKR